MARYRLASTQSWTLVLAFASLGLGTTGLMSQENHTPVAQGGLIQQLRSFTQDALGSRDASDDIDSFNSRPQPNYMPPTPAKAIPRPAAKQGARPASASNQSTSWLERFISRRAPEEEVAPEPMPRYATRQRSDVANYASVNEGYARPSTPDSDLPQVITPNDLRGQRKATPAQPSSLRSTKNSGEVFVEQEIPERVRRSLSQSEPEDLAPSASQAGISSLADAQLPSNADPRTAPRVARIPLPGADSTPKQETKTPVAPRSSGQVASETPLRPNTPAKLDTAERPESVSVPTQLVNTPMAEKAPQTLNQRKAVNNFENLPATLGSDERTARSDYPSTPPPAHVETQERQLPVPALPQAQNQTPQYQQSPQAPLALPQISSLPARQSVQGTEARPSVGNDEQLRMESPHIQVVLNGPSDLPVGLPVAYQVVVNNADHIDLQGLVLRMDVPPGIALRAMKPSRGEFEVEKAKDGSTMLTWGFEYLAAGESAQAPLEIVASAAQNFAVAMEWSLIPISSNAKLAVRSPRMELALTGPAEVNYGKPNTYRLELRNAGDAVAKNVAVTISAEPYGVSTTEIGDIEAGGGETIEIELIFNQRGPIRIGAMASALGNLVSETHVAVLVKKAELSVDMLGPKLVYHGAAINYVARVSNPGDAAAENVMAVLNLPTSATPITLPEGAQLAGQQLTWPVASIEPGATLEFPVQLRLTDEGENQVAFSCSGENGLAAACQVITAVQSIADLKLLVSDPVAPAPVGSEVVYELNLTNRGSKAASNVKVLAQFSEGIDPTHAEGHPNRVVPGQLFFETIPSIDAGQSVTLKIYALAAKSGTHRFRAEVRSDESDLHLVQEETTRFLGNDARIALPPTSQVIR